MVGDTHIIHIETVPGACKKLQNSHNLAYEHPPERQVLESERETHVAHLNSLILEPSIFGACL